MAEVNTIGFGAPLRWLALGWQDFTKTFAPSLIYGTAIALVSFGIWRALIETNLAFWALTLSCGFVFIAPMLAMGLYEAGRRLGNGEKPTLKQMIFVRGALRSDVCYLGLVLVLIYLFWSRVAQIVYGLSTYHLHTTVKEFIDFSIGTAEGHTMLIAGTITGGAMAMFTFAISVISTPMLLDEKANVFEAIFTSLASVAKNFFPMLFWAALITALLIACAATSWLGLAIVFPWLGLASWRAYRDITAPNQVR
ncbi:DUF2189 domain-containing protein [Candidatus Viadribacter manganicus]|uniref:DUF2189 domain-containing protein n=1 Tax=Candidatus Viadribacter manganicus TaxID=1759059 RepID=UPI0012EA3A36|nr:DUF2189 domain-containing protein [Candidatus Viadribacter manganicus]